VTTSPSHRSETSEASTLHPEPPDPPWAWVSRPTSDLPARWSLAHQEAVAMRCDAELSV
jgi:hypothetical protein